MRHPWATTMATLGAGGRDGPGLRGRADGAAAARVGHRGPGPRPELQAGAAARTSGPSRWCASWCRREQAAEAPASILARPVDLPPDTSASSPSGRQSGGDESVMIYFELSDEHKAVERDGARLGGREVAPKIHDLDREHRFERSLPEGDGRPAPARHLHPRGVRRRGPRLHQPGPGLRGAGVRGHPPARDHVRARRASTA